MGAGADADVFREVFPADYAGTIDEKFGRAGNIMLFRAGALVQQVVAANRFCLRIAEKREAVALFLAQILGNCGQVHTDGHWPHAMRREFLQIFLDASQLEVAVGSPITTIEDKQNGFGRRSAGGGQKELGEGGGLAGTVRQCEIRYALADLRRAARTRKFAGADKEECRGGDQEQTENYNDGAPDFATIDLGLRKGAKQADQEKEQGQHRQDQVYPGKRRRWNSQEVKQVAQDGENEEEKANPEHAVGSYLRLVWHERAETSTSGVGVQ